MGPHVIWEAVGYWELRDLASVLPLPLNIYMTLEIISGNFNFFLTSKSWVNWSTCQLAPKWSFEYMFYAYSNLYLCCSLPKGIHVIPAFDIRFCIKKQLILQFSQPPKDFFVLSRSVQFEWGCKSFKNFGEVVQIGQSKRHKWLSLLYPVEIYGILITVDLHLWWAGVIKLFGGSKSLQIGEGFALLGCWLECWTGKFT